MFKQVARIKFWFLFLLFAQAWGEENNVCMGNKEETLAKLRALKKHYECAMSNSLTECSDWLVYSGFAVVGAGISLTVDGASICTKGAYLDGPSLFKNLFQTSVPEAVAAGAACMPRAEFMEKYPQALGSNITKYLNDSKILIDKEILSVTQNMETVKAEYLGPNWNEKDLVKATFKEYADSFTEGKTLSKELLDNVNKFKKNDPKFAEAVSKLDNQAKMIKEMNKALLEIRKVFGRVAEASLAKTPFLEMKALVETLPVFPKKESMQKALDTIRLQTGMSQVEAAAARSAAAKVVQAAGEKALSRAALRTALLRVGVKGIAIVGGTVMSGIVLAVEPSSVGCSEDFSRYSTLAEGKCEDNRIFDEKKIEFFNLPEEEQWKEIGKYNGTFCVALKDMYNKISAQVWKAQCHSGGGYTLTNKESPNLTQTVNSSSSRALIQGIESNACQFVNLDEQTNITSVSVMNSGKSACDINQRSPAQYEIPTKQIVEQPVTKMERMARGPRERIKARDTAEGAWGLFKNSQMAHVEVSQCCSHQTADESLCQKYGIVPNSPSSSSGPAKPSTGVH